jgi:hypothetical protein
MLRRPLQDGSFEGLSVAVRLGSLGLYMALCVGGLTWLGSWLDRVWQTGFLLTGIGFFLGMAAGFWGVFREVLRVDNKE